jgi:hypothetical protein
MSENKTDQTQPQTGPGSAPSPTQNMAGAPAAKTKMVKVKAKQHLQFADGRSIRENEVGEVSEEEAVELCKPIEGTYNFSGELVSSQAGRHKHIRAERVV